MTVTGSRIRLLAAMAMTALVCVAGCDQRSQRGVGHVVGTAFGQMVLEGAKEQARTRIEREVAPLIVASVIGEFAPGGGLAVLNGLLADKWWDERLQAVAAESEPIQDIFPRSPLTPVVNREN